MKTPTRTFYWKLIFTERGPGFVESNYGSYITTYAKAWKTVNERIVKAGSRADIAYIGYNVNDSKGVRKSTHLKKWTRRTGWKQL